MGEWKRQGLNRNRPSGTDRVYFPDLDGLTAQISSINIAPDIRIRRSAELRSHIRQHSKPAPYNYLVVAPAAWFSYALLRSARYSSLPSGSSK